MTSSIQHTFLQHLVTQKMRVTMLHTCTHAQELSGNKMTRENEKAINDY